MMIKQQQILDHFSDKDPGNVLFLPDLTLWYEWHIRQGTLPDVWLDHTLPQICRAMGSERSGCLYAPGISSTRAWK